MAYNAEAQKRYNQKFTFISLKYSNKEEAEVLSAIENLMQETGLSRQAVIKDLILKGLQK